MRGGGGGEKGECDGHDGGDGGDRLEEEGEGQASNNTKQNDTQAKENDKS